jgi:protein-disulfide isomerase
MNLRSAVFPLLLASVACACGAGATPPAPPPVASSAPVTWIQPTALAVVPGEDDAVVPVSSRNPTWGSRAALVTIVEYSDFQCPYCAMVEPTLSRVRETYGPDSVRIVWKNNPLPFHPSAEPAAEAAMGVLALAGPDAFWRFHDAAFRDQKALGPESYERWAREAGVADTTTLRAGLESHRWAPAIDADVREARSLGANGTPTFFLNGVLVVGAQPFEKFQAVIDDQLRAAREKLASGTPREQLYTELARDNRARGPKPGDDDDDEPADTKTVFKIPVGGSPVLGSPAALVTIVEFSDFQCPFCARVEPTLAAIRARYGDKVRLVWKNEPLPFHKNAEPAAQAALELRAEKGDAAFWAMHDRLYAAPGDLSPETLTQLAVSLGASGEKVKRAMAAHTHAREIDGDQDLADDFQANGTPHFFINGRRLVGAQPEEKFDGIIDEEIQKASALLAAGTRPEALYEALTRDGKGAPEPERKDLPRSLPPNEPARGNPAAKVTMHEWGDFQCPFCGRAQATVEQVLKDYGTRVRLVWHDLPLPMHPDAPLAAQAGREALQQRGPTAFWVLHDRMFADQHKLGRDDLDGYARALRLDMRHWKTSLDGGAHGAEIEAEKSVAEAMGIVGTPAFVVVPGGGGRGYFISGAQPYSRFHKIIERALGEAR